MPIVRHFRRSSSWWVYYVGQGNAYEELLPYLESYARQIVAARRMGHNLSTVLLSFSDYHPPHKVYIYFLAHRVVRNAPTIQIRPKCRAFVVPLVLALKLGIFFKVPYFPV